MLELRALTADRGFAAGLLLAAAGLFVSQCITVGSATIDDAYFTFSFAKNLALGNGPVYSHGVRVEGYSAFLWMLLLAPGFVITQGEAPLIVARVTGAPFVVLLGWSSYRLARSFGAPRPLAAGCVLLLACNTDLAVAYLTGMETLPFVALVTFALALCARAELEPRLRPLLPWAGLLVALMRIDGFLAGGFVAGCALLLEARRGDPRGVRELALRWAPALTLYALWFAWRWRYYGLPLPSTYYAKSLIAQALPMRGIEYVAEELEGVLFVGLLAWHWLLWRTHLLAALLGSFALLHLIYVVSVGGDWMPFARFVLPVVPLLLALLGGALADGLERLRARGPLARSLFALSGLAVCFAVAARTDHRYLNTRNEADKRAHVAIQSRNVRNWRKAAAFLRAVVPPGARLVTDYGGVLSVHTDAAIIEMWGLANASIATRGNTADIDPIYGRTCPACYAELDPEFFHVGAPMVRKEPAFRSRAEVLGAVWQSPTIGRYVDFASFAVGRVVQPKRGQALYFLQKRGPGFSAASRTAEGGFVIEYPFEHTRKRS